MCIYIYIRVDLLPSSCSLQGLHHNFIMNILGIFHVKFKNVSSFIYLFIFVMIKAVVFSKVGAGIYKSDVLYMYR